jgi:cytochrome c peroxidase
MKINYLLIISFLFTTIVACTKEGANDISENDTLEIPGNFPAMKYNINLNAYSKEKQELGKKLFYDGRLSSDGNISCGSCHQQFAAFAHADHNVSHGVEDRLGTRNSPALFNLAWQSSFFWDGGVFNLDLFHVSPIENPVEMNNKIDSVVNMLKRDKDYPTLFKKAFNTNNITSINLSQALSAFLVSMVSNDSKYDEYLAGKTTLTTAETEGMQLFEQKCASCHSGILFSDFDFRNNGLSTRFDLGRFHITLVETDSFKFKTPSLRNIEKSSPYMHDGRFNTLEQVLNHYSSGVVKTTTTLDTILQRNSQLGIALTADEKTKIIAFLKTLTDNKFLTDSRFSEF